MVAEPDDLEPLVNFDLEPGETLHARTRSQNATLAVSDRRLLIGSADRVRLSVPFDQLRRVQFDIERHRPATLVIVPDQPSDPPEVLSIPSSEYSAAAVALAEIGRRFHLLGRDDS